MKLSFIILIVLSIIALAYSSPPCTCTDTQYFNVITKTCTDKAANCHTHTFDSSNDTYPCTKCESTYFLKDNECTLITIDNCTRATTNSENEEICEKCSQGNHPSQDKKSCEANTPNAIIGCEEYEYESPSSNGFNCLKCLSGYHLYDSKNCRSNPMFGQSGEVFGCIEYGLKLGSLICVSCSRSGIMAQSPQGACDVLQNFSPNCTKVSPYEARLCAECTPGYLLNTSANSCVAYPATAADTGYDANCEQYYWFSGEIKCWKCKTGWVAVDKVCTKEVPSGDLITDCIEYDYDSSATPQYGCVKCKDNFWGGIEGDRYSSCEECHVIPTTPPPGTPGAPGDPGSSGSIIIQIGVLFMIVLNIVIL